MCAMRNVLDLDKTAFLELCLSQINSLDVRVLMNGKLQFLIII